MVTTLEGEALLRRRRQRWLVHLGLIGSALTSLVFEPVLALHVLFGVIFAVLVGGHLAQRRRVSVRLAKRLVRCREILMPASRLALADGLLLLVTTVMLVSGFWDFWGPHRTKIRWHALSGVILAIYLLVHTLRRRRRLRVSQVR
jgi:hypothetical protein